MAQSRSRARRGLTEAMDRALVVLMAKKRGSRLEEGGGRRREGVER